MESRDPALQRRYGALASWKPELPLCSPEHPIVRGQVYYFRIAQEEIC